MCSLKTPFLLLPAILAAFLSHSARACVIGDAQRQAVGFVANNVVGDRNRQAVGIISGVLIGDRNSQAIGRFISAQELGQPYDVVADRSGKAVVVIRDSIAYAASTHLAIGIGSQCTDIELGAGALLLLVH